MRKGKMMYIHIYFDLTTFWGNKKTSKKDDFSIFGGLGRT